MLRGEEVPEMDIGIGIDEPNPDIARKTGNIKTIMSMGLRI
jgi:hypothetical protein